MGASLNFVGWAEAVGAQGRRIEGPGEITRGLLDELLADGRPAVLDIRHDRQVRVRGGGRVEAIRDEIGSRES